VYLHAPFLAQAVLLTFRHLDVFTRCRYIPRFGAKRLLPSLLCGLIVFISTSPDVEDGLIFLEKSPILLLKVKNINYNFQENVQRV
jgi:hypothetical protein